MRCAASVGVDELVDDRRPGASRRAAGRRCRPCPRGGSKLVCGPDRGELLGVLHDRDQLDAVAQHLPVELAARTACASRCLPSTALIDDADAERSASPPPRLRPESCRSGSRHWRADVTSTFLPPFDIPSGSSRRHRRPYPSGQPWRAPALALVKVEGIVDG